MTNDRFRESIEIDFGDENIQDKDQLASLMRIAGYHTKWNKEKKRKQKLYPTQTQLDSAWEHLKENE